MGKRIPHGKGDKGGSHPQSGRDLVRYKRNRLERGKCSGLKPDRSEALPMCAACAPPGPQRAEQGGRDFTGLNLRTPQADAPANTVRRFPHGSPEQRRMARRLSQRNGGSRSRPGRRKAARVRTAAVRGRGSG